MQSAWDGLDQAKCALDEGEPNIAAGFLQCALEAVGGDPAGFSASDRRLYDEIRRGIVEIQFGKQVAC